MSDLASNVTWQGILRETEAGDLPHCRAVASPLKWHEEITETLARIILGSYRPIHPDLLITGTITKAPNIDECRELINGIALKPLEAQRRLGIINCADKLLLPAANSLLKLAEEPPEHACLLFLMEDGRLFLPTLRSRSRFSVLVSYDEVQARRMPEEISDWIEWIAETRKPPKSEQKDSKDKSKKAKPNEDENEQSESKVSKLDEIIQDLDAWANYAVSDGNFALAERINSLKLTAEKKNLSVPMLCDMIIMTLREENNKIEHIFDDLR